MKRIALIFFSAMLAAAFFSCKENSLEKQRKNELKKLDEYIRAHHAEVKRKPSGLYYIPIKEGTGDSIKIGYKVQVFLTISSLDSLKQISTGNYEPLELVVYPPTQLSSGAESVDELKALHEALTYMKKGSKSHLIFDSQIGFGQYGAYGFGGFTPLMMDVEVYKVYPTSLPSEE